MSLDYPQHRSGQPNFPLKIRDSSLDKGKSEWGREFGICMFFGCAAAHWKQPKMSCNSAKKNARKKFLRAQSKYV
jgi:hypothetical protein